ncbi:MAG: hypothetical protein AAF202_00220 [Pseudomonadota bacterium]
MSKLQVIALTALSVFTAIFLSACGGDNNDNKRSSGSEYIEVEGLCFNKDSEREVSLARCDDADAPRYEISGNDCCRVDGRRDERVNDRICDIYYDRGFGSSIGGSRSCNGILYFWNGFQMQQVDCGYYDCRNQTLYRDYSGRDEIRCW